MRERASSQRGKRLVFSNAMESNRRLALRRIGALTGLAVLSGPSVLLGGCGGGGGDSAIPAVPPVAIPLSPTLGAHGLFFSTLFENVDSVSVGPLATQASGSTILACVGRGEISQHALPTDNMGNAPYQQLGTSQPYTLWQTSGTALYAFEGATGSASHQVSVANLPLVDDEVTLAVVEVKNGRHIEAVSWVERLAAPLTSAKVTTTGPATLVAFWWGDGNVNLHTAEPEAGWTALDSLLINELIVQCAVAVKDVNMAGEYDVTWTATPAQGAQLWLVAVQSLP